jgi:hypothetical protein
MITQLFADDLSYAPYSVDDLVLRMEAECPVVGVCFDKSFVEIGADGSVIGGGADALVNGPIYRVMFNEYGLGLAFPIDAESDGLVDLERVKRQLLWSMLNTLRARLQNDGLSEELGGPPGLYWRLKPEFGMDLNNLRGHVTHYIRARWNFARLTLRGSLIAAARGRE